MPHKIIINVADSENPFRPEGELAHEADEYVRDFVTKKQAQLDQSLKSTSSLNNNQSKSVSLILSQTVGDVATGTEQAVNSTPTANGGGGGNASQVEATPKSASKKDKKDKKSSSSSKNGAAHKDSCCNGNGQQQNGTTANGEGAAADESKKKVKSKCGCVIS